MSISALGWVFFSSFGIIRVYLIHPKCECLCLNSQIIFILYCSIIGFMNRQPIYVWIYKWTNERMNESRLSSRRLGDFLNMNSTLCLFVFFLIHLPSDQIFCMTEASSFHREIVHHGVLSCFFLNILTILSQCPRTSFINAIWCLLPESQLQKSSVSHVFREACFRYPPPP